MTIAADRWPDRTSSKGCASLLELLNAGIDDRDAHIGPSYFMTPNQSKERLARIWRTQILPLLQEAH